MDYGKLQLSFILLLIMTVIQFFTAVIIIKKAWLIITSLIAITLCLLGLIYALKMENEAAHKQKSNFNKK